MHPETIGPFRIDGVVGHGGTGVVYRSVDPRTGRPVALKVVPPAADRRTRRRLRREAEVLARIRHPTIARLHRVVHTADQLVLVLEFIEGIDLRSRLAAGPLSVDDALRVAQTVAEGLAHAHAAAVVHRDLKPSNVILAPEGRATILDFGLAKLLDPDRRIETTLTLTGDLPGTLAAMSPEQVTGRPLDDRSDLFALGVLVYESVSGRHPFRAATPPETVHRICYYEPPAVTSPHGELPRSAAELIHRLLAKKPRRRPASAATVAAALAAARGVDPPDLPEPASAVRIGLARWIVGVLRRAPRRPAPARP